MTALWESARSIIIVFRGCDRPRYFSVAIFERAVTVFQLRVVAVQERTRSIALLESFVLA